MCGNSDVECFPEEEEVEDSSPSRTTSSVSLVAERQFYILVAEVRFFHGVPGKLVESGLLHHFAKVASVTAPSVQIGYLPPALFFGV